MASNGTRTARWLWIASALAAAALFAGAARAQDASPSRRDLEAELGRLEEVARVATSSETLYRALCDGAQDAFDLADPEGDRSGDFAARGVDLADRARRLFPDRAEGHYRYALCLGLYLREHPLSGIKRSSELVRAGERAAALDGTFDHGGPHRFLAILYAEAPRFLGPGDHDKAREHLARLMEIAPDDEDNKLAAARVSIALGDDDAAREYLSKVRPERAPAGMQRQSLMDERARLQKKLDD